MAKEDMIFRPRPEYRELARDLRGAPALKWRLFHIDLDRVGFYYEETCEDTDHIAECLRVNEPWRSVLADAGVFWDWLVVVYGRHAEGKSAEWLKIVLYHELRHIGIDGKVAKHTTEDFADILEDFGIRWTDDKEALPDITKMELKLRN